MNNKIPIIFWFIVSIILPGGTVFAKAPDTLELTHQGDTYFQQGHFQSAAKSWEKSLVGIDCTQNAAHCIDVMTRLAAAYQALEMHQTMLVTLEQALSIADVSNDIDRRALVYSQLSDAWLSVGFSELTLSLDATANQVVPATEDADQPKYLKQALLLAEKSVTDATEAKNSSILARALNTQGNVWQVQGQQAKTSEAYNDNLYKALDAYKKSREAAENAGDTTLAIKASLNRLNLVITNNVTSLSEQLVTLDDLWEQIENLPNSYDKARYLLSLGVFTFNVLQDDKLLKQEQATTKAMLQEGGCVITDSGTILLSQVAEDLYACTPDDQHQTLEVVLLMTEEEQQSTHALLGKKGFSQSDSQKALSRAYFAYQNAVQVARDLQDTNTMSIAYGHLGSLYEEERRYEEALTLTRKAIFFATQGSQPYSSQRNLASSQLPVSVTSHFSHRLYRWYWQQGRILKVQGKLDQAIAAYHLASVNLKPIQSLLDVGYRLSPDLFQKVVRPVHYGLADLLLQKAEATPDIQEQQSFMREAIEAVELVKVAELQDYFNDECVTALHAKTVSILDYQKMSSKLQQVLQQTVILYPIPLADRLVVLISFKGKLYQKSLLVTDEELNETALALRINLQTRPHNRFLLHAKRLHDWLISPFETFMTDHQVDTLVIVPDGNLRMIPFSTLHDGKYFLVEKYAMSITPGLKLVAPQRINWNDGKLFLVGLSEGVQEHSPLDNVPQELQNIQLIADPIPSKHILNQEYSFENFHEQIKRNQFSVIHLATHGEFSADPEHTYLLTYFEKMHMDDLQNAIGLGRFRDKPLELLTLSACKTAVGDDKAALGLAGVAVKAGARSAIATLWYVDDEATSIAISEFYQQLLLNPGISKAKALQEMQKKLIQIKRYWHPSYWAPFLLIGNWL